MYYKLYRRRKLFFLGIFLILIVFVFFYANDSSVDQASSNSQIRQKLSIFNHDDKLNNNDNENRFKAKRARINAETYKTPAPCVGCPGENGRPVYLTDEENKGIEEVYKKEFFNLRVSDKVSLWRSIPDARDHSCKSIQYPDDLPTASVIFIFKNERWSSILRSVYSVINRSPRHLLKEVILVDDLSDIGLY